MQHRTLATMGLTLLLVTGMSGVGLAAPLATTDARVQERATTVMAVQDGNETANQTEGDEQGVDLGQVNATALDAIQLAQNRTQGKVVDVELGTRNGNVVYSLAFLEENRSVTGVLVDVSNRSIVTVEPNVSMVSERQLGAQAFDFGELLTAAEAIEAAKNVTNGTVVEVELSEGALIYRVEFRSATGGQTEVLVAAAEGPVLSVQSEPAAQQNETQQGTETDDQ